MTRTPPLARSATSKPGKSRTTNQQPQTKTSPSQGAGRIRIIGGQWRRTMLPVANKPGLRPTPDRVRETLFNWLGQDLTGLYCLDAFAGSGALGFEAASRHAAHTLLIEQDRTVINQLQSNAQRLGADSLKIRQGDGLQALRQLPNSSNSSQGWDVIFIDPPYAAELEIPALQAARATIAPEGMLYLESARTWTEDELTVLGWQRLRHLSAGSVHAHILQRL